ncbi:MAG TPA: diaminopimelate epimerase [Steroidobacteraceae bacterium]|nr:diaminopimelate epimerase [Steroidobacteraceae bacterium]
MRIDFTKMHGLGNDFIVFEAARDGPLPTPQQFRRLGDRHTGIGFDQALVLLPAQHPGASLYYRIFNADGTEVEQCGNGARCIAALLHRLGRVALGEAVVMESLGGEVCARVLSPETIAVNMGEPRFEPRAVPFDAPSDALSHVLEVDGTRVQIGVVSLGNPHAVLTVDSVDTAPVERLGPAIEAHPRFPKRVNVGFMQLVDRGHLRLRVHERGAGETLACGTGACAAVVVARRRGLTDAEVTVEVRGGQLRVNWDAPGPVWLTGPAKIAFEGHVEL